MSQLMFQGHLFPSGSTVSMVCWAKMIPFPSHPAVAFYQPPLFDDDNNLHIFLLIFPSLRPLTLNPA